MDNNQKNNQNNNGNGPQRKQSLFMLLIAVLMTLMFMSFMMRMISSGSEEITYSKFISMVKEDKVESVFITDDELEITPKEGKRDLSGNAIGTMAPLISYGSVQTATYYTGNLNDENLYSLLDEHGVEYTKEIPNSSGLILNFLLTWILPIILLYIVFTLLFRKMGGSGGMFGVGKNNAKVYVQKETGVTFADVAGEEEAKESLQEVVDFLHNPQKYTQIGAKLPKGVLLVGSPGTGKTLLAKAVAGEAHVPFFSLTGSDFVELYVGVGASRVRDLFEEANKNSPCIIFIDEIDAIGRSRDSKYGGGNEEREQTLNQLLSEMDGFDSGKGILILGATNRPEILDKALLRPGRFDRRVIVDKPDLKGRVEILKVHAKNVNLDESVDLDAIALATSGAVGSDLANMINEAAINAVKAGRKAVSQKDLFDAVEVVLVGKEKKDRIMSEEERRIVSYHEVGHALISALQKNSEPVQKITIVPRTMGALGYVMQVPEEEKFLNTKAELHDMLVGLLGGRAAEEIVFDTVTTGASNDIEKATSIARSMVTQYGMSKKFGLIGLETTESRYLDGRTVMNCSDETAAEVDQEVMKILKDCYKEAKALLKDNRKLMDKLAKHLIEKETITGKEFMEIYRKAKGLPQDGSGDGNKKKSGKNGKLSARSEKKAEGGSLYNRVYDSMEQAEAHDKEQREGAAKAVAEMKAAGQTENGQEENTKEAGENGDMRQASTETEAEAGGNTAANAPEETGANGGAQEAPEETGANGGTQEAPEETGANGEMRETTEETGANDGTQEATEETGENSAANASEDEESSSDSDGSASEEADREPEVLQDGEKEFREIFANFANKEKSAGEAEKPTDDTSEN
ncbi:MAG: ATP-dependent zinc metalloprotease FtsH [Lachnospiraceae bacterium]|nr:ATP-dependent zinc metalloprotease FtsH [Lachnospiraceae bacterium]